MSNLGLNSNTLQLFSQSEQFILLKFQSQLNKTIQSLHQQKYTNSILIKQKQNLENQLIQSNIKLSQSNIKLSQYIKYQQQHNHSHKPKHQQKLKSITLNNKKHLSKIKNQKQIDNKLLSKPFQQHTQCKQSVTIKRNIKIMIIQQFIQLVAALIIMKIKFPSKFKYIKKLLPPTFILIRLSVFIITTHFQKIISYLKNITHQFGTENIYIKINTLSVFYQEIKKIKTQFTLNKLKDNRIFKFFSTII